MAESDSASRRLLPAGSTHALPQQGFPCQEVQRYTEVTLGADNNIAWLLGPGAVVGAGRGVESRCVEQGASPHPACLGPVPHVGCQRFQSPVSTKGVRWLQCHLLPGLVPWACLQALCEGHPLFTLSHPRALCGWCQCAPHRVQRSLSWGCTPEPRELVLGTLSL